MVAPSGSGPFELSALVTRSVTGDEAAFVVIVERFKPLVFRWAVALCGDADDAEDITQEVFLRVHRKLATFRGDGPVEGWLYRITRRVLLRTRRKSARKPQTGNPSLDVYTTDPGARIDRQRAVDLIRAIAAELPMRQREVFVLCDLEGRTPSEAALLLGLKDVSVRASLFKARASIRRNMLKSHPHYREHTK
jgi:RNA polymerase sigma-70 factor (ECF subfamily)